MFELIAPKVSQFPYYLFSSDVIESFQSLDRLGGSLYHLNTQAAEFQVKEEVSNYDSLFIIVVLALLDSQ